MISCLSGGKMVVAQKLICKKLGADDDYQSVLNVQKRRVAPCRAVKNEHIQLLHDGSGHWVLTFCSNERIQICDSLKMSLNWVNRNCVHALYKNCVKELIISFCLSKNKLMSRIVVPSQ